MHQFVPAPWFAGRSWAPNTPLRRELVRKDCWYAYEMRGSLSHANQFLG